MLNLYSGLYKVTFNQLYFKNILEFVFIYLMQNVTVSREYNEYLQWLKRNRLE